MYFTHNNWLTSTFMLLDKSMVHPHGEFANSVWCPFKQGDITEIKKNSKEGN